jgi:hypothetical protein
MHYIEQLLWSSAIVTVLTVRYVRPKRTVAAIQSEPPDGIRVRVVNNLPVYWVDDNRPQQHLLHY